MAKEESKDAGKINAVEKEAEDLEKGNANAAVPAPLYPKMAEDPHARWAFIRKVYTILAAQFIFTSAVGAIGAFVHPIPKFFLSGGLASIAVFFAILFSPFIGIRSPNFPICFDFLSGALIWISNGDSAMFPMLIFRRKHPINLVLLSLYTVCISCSIGMISGLFGGEDSGPILSIFCFN
ncbi:hypothetical protein DsansV1_C26g0195711 [Dioscorea sansibarensis]